MFTDLNDKLTDVKEKARKKVKYEEHLERATAYLKEEEAKRDKLKRQLEKEKEDVARLEGFSLTNIFYTLTGRKLEKLDKEQQEVLAAKLKYTEALETIEDVEKEILLYKEKLLPVANANAEYDVIIQEKEKLIHDTNSIWSEELFTYAEKEAELNSNIKEYTEAIDAGKDAVFMLNRAIESLDSAMGWSTFDMFGGGMLTTAIKHSRLDDARDRIHQAQNRLRHFQEELLDIENHFHANIEIGGLLTFADYFFDGIIVDWMVHGKITESYNRTKKTKQDVSNLLLQLEEQRNTLETELLRTQQKRTELLESAK